MKKIIIYSIASILMLMQSPAYSLSKLIKDNDFYTIGNEAVTFLKKVDKIKPITRRDAVGNITIDTKEITDYILENRIMIDKLISEVEAFKDSSNNTKNSEALILLGAIYLTINLKEAIYTQDAIKTYSEIVDTDNLYISREIKDLLKGLTVSHIFNPIPGESWMIDLSEDNRLRIVFSRALITEYLKKGKYEEARLILEDFKAKNNIVGFYQNIDSLDSFIMSWEKREKGM